MTTKSLNVYKGTTVRYSIHKPHYWYVDDAIQVNEDTVKNVTLEKFNLQNVTYQGSLISIPSQTVWDNTVFNGTGTVCEGMLIREPWYVTFCKLNFSSVTFFTVSSLTCIASSTYQGSLISIPSQTVWDNTVFNGTGTVALLPQGENYFVKDGDGWNFYSGIASDYWNGDEQKAVVYQNNYDNSVIVQFVSDGEEDKDKTGYKWLGPITIPSGDAYKNYMTTLSLTGSLVFNNSGWDNNVGDVTGFNLSNYLTIPAEAFEAAGDEWELSIKAHFVRRGSYYHTLTNTVADGNNLMVVYNYSPGINTKYFGTITSGDDYIFKLRKLGGKYCLFVGDASIVDEGAFSWYNLKTDFKNFSVYTGSFNFSKGLRLGAGTASNNYWNDSIKLSQVFLKKIDSTYKSASIVWVPTINTQFGSYVEGDRACDFYPTDQWYNVNNNIYLDTDWALVGFTNAANSAITTTYKYSYDGSGDCQWKCHIKMPTTPATTRGDLMYANTTTTNGSCLYITTDQKVEFRMPGSGVVATTSDALQAGKEYYIEVNIDSSGAYLVVTDENHEWYTDGSGSVSSFNAETNTTNMYLGISTGTVANYFRGGIFPDIDTCIYVNGEKVWAMIR